MMANIIFIFITLWIYRVIIKFFDWVNYDNQIHRDLCNANHYHVELHYPE